MAAHIMGKDRRVATQGGLEIRGQELSFSRKITGQTREDQVKIDLPGDCDIKARIAASKCMRVRLRIGQNGSQGVRQRG